MTEVDVDDTLDAYGEISETDLSIRPRDFAELVIAPTDWTIGVLVDLLKRKKIDLQPNYQRRVAWTPDKMSKFIESLFLRLPVPQIVLAEMSPGRFAVIDGKQRLNSIARFCIDTDGPLRLKDCDYKADLNGLTYADMLSNPDLEDAVDAFQSHTVRTIVVKNWGSNELIYLLFLRLNQNSVTLSPQELRRALFPGEFLNWLDDTTTNSPAMKEIFATVPDFRMRDMEVAIRYLGFSLYGSEYRGNLKLFLDDVTKSINKRWDEIRLIIEGKWRDYEKSVSVTVQIFGGDAFKVWQNGRFQRSRNRAVMDIMTYYFSAEDTAYVALRNSAAVKEAFKTICEEDEEFLRALQTSTKTEPATNLRFLKWGKKLQETLNSGVTAYPSNRLSFV